MSESVHDFDEVIVDAEFAEIFLRGKPMSTVSEVLNEALELSQPERAEVAHRLLLSLEPDDDEREVDEAWAQVIRQRLHDIRQGKVELVDWDVARDRIRAALSIQTSPDSVCVLGSAHQ